MTALPIYLIPHDVLRQVAAPIDEAGLEAARKLADDMLDTMYAAEGIGLAAPQVGIAQRLIVLDVDQGGRDDRDGTPGNPLVLINPEIMSASEEPSIYNEGCLSIPEQFAEVERPAAVRVGYIGLDGTRHEIEADGLLSTCLQHEIDHLNGVLFIDYLSKLKQDMIARKVKKLAKLEGWMNDIRVM